MRSHLLSQLHDTEMWASYLPRIPLGLYVLAFFGIVLAFESIFQFQTSDAVIYLLGLGLAILLLLPALLAGGFALWKWNYTIKVRKQLLGSIPWRGDEMVLDVGCGSGLMLNGAAMNLKSGKAIGIDLWSGASGGGNLELLWKNAMTEKVASQIDFRQGDARALPFDSGMFNVVLSSGALHHISHNLDDHERAVREMIRVLKPGGHLAMWDVSHMIEATASKMRPLGIVCEIKEQGRFLGYDMSVILGEKKTGSV